MVSSVIDITDFLTWYKRSAPHIPDFMEGHANAEIIGPRGLEVREDIIVGVTIMRSGLTYPDHHHSPEEIYIVLSEGHWRQNDNPWKSPGPGGYVYNPPNILHAMKSVETPLFVICYLVLETIAMSGYGTKRPSMSLWPAITPLSALLFPEHYQHQFLGNVNVQLHIYAIVRSKLLCAAMAPVG